MNKILLGILLCSAGVTAEPQTYHTLPDPSYRLVSLGTRMVIQDARGFFFGYYTPLPTPALPFVPTSPQATSGRYTGQAGRWSSVFSVNPNPQVYDISSDNGYADISDFSQWCNCGYSGGSCP